MTDAQHELPKRMPSHKMLKLGIASAIFFSACAYFFAPDNIHIPGTNFWWSPPWRGGRPTSSQNPGVATDETSYLTIISAQDGSKRHIAIPAEPAGDFGDPASPVDEDVGMRGYADGIDAIKALAAAAETGTDAGQAFSEIVAQTAISSSGGGPNAAVRLGSILLAVWYQRDHPGTSFADAADAVKQSPPDIRRIKKAAHVALLWLGSLSQSADDASATTDAATPTPGAKSGNRDPIADPDPAGTQWKLDTDARYGHTSAADGDAAKVVVGYGIKYQAYPSLPLAKGMGDRAYAAFVKECRESTSDDDYGASRGYSDTIDRVAEDAAIEAIRSSKHDGVPSSYREAAERLFESVSADADLKQAEDMAKQSVDKRMKADGISNCLDK